MTNGPLFQPPATEQKVKQNNWNTHEFGFDPRNIVETLAANFIKAFSFISGWDSNAQTWRALNVDSEGNLKVTNGTQNSASPAITTFLLTTTSQTILAFNPSRSSFSLINDDQVSGGLVEPILLSYPNQRSTEDIYVPVGFVYSDNTWQGDVSGRVQGGAPSQTVTIIEYY